MHGHAGALEFTQHEKVQAFNLFARPWRFAKEFQARSDAGLAGEAADVDVLPKLFPAIVRGQSRNHGFKFDAMQGVAWLISWRPHAFQFV